MQLSHPYLMSLFTSDLKPERPPPQVILVVDDEVLIRSVIAEYLRECGFHVFEAADGSEAIEILQGAGMPIDLVFSDVQMPKLGGFELARWFGKIGLTCKFS